MEAILPNAPDLIGALTVNASTTIRQTPAGVLGADPVVSSGFPTRADVYNRAVAAAGSVSANVLEVRRVQAVAHHAMRLTA